VPIARLVLGAGLQYQQFEALARRAFVAAASEADSGGRAVNVSRIAVRTGLSRKLVSKLREELTLAPDDLVEQVGRAARALEVWHSDPDFLTKEGRPKDLSFDAGDSSFVELVRRVGGDVPAGAVRAELVAAAGITELSNGMYRVEKRYYIPAALNEDLVVGFAFIVAPLLDALRHNIEKPSDAFLQRVAYSDHLPQELTRAFRTMTHEQAEQFLETVNAWLSANEAESGTSSKMAGRVGVGVYYFEAGSNN
jgi:hypothetical protein